jgi:rubrerythrin
MNLRGSETEKNLLKAFAGESQARNRYTFFASVAVKEGYEQISGIFQETADNEKEHGKVFFKYLQKSGGTAVEIIAEYPAGKIGTTAENLLAAADGEKGEWSSLYPKFSEVAKKEGFKDIAESFKQIGEVEEKHEIRYRKLLENLKEKKVFKKDGVVRWKCRNCGYIHEGKEAPKVCPACKHPQAFYELFVETY